MLKLSNMELSKNESEKLTSALAVFDHEKGPKITVFR